MRLLPLIALVEVLLTLLIAIYLYLGDGFTNWLSVAFILLAIGNIVISLKASTLKSIALIPFAKLMAIVNAGGFIMVLFVGQLSVEGPYPAMYYFFGAGFIISIWGINNYRKHKYQMEGITPPTFRQILKTFGQKLRESARKIYKIRSWPRHIQFGLLSALIAVILWFIPIPIGDGYVYRFGTGIPFYLPGFLIFFINEYTISRLPAEIIFLSITLIWFLIGGVLGRYTKKTSFTVIIRDLFILLSIAVIMFLIDGPVDWFLLVLLIAPFWFLVGGVLGRYIKKTAIAVIIWLFMYFIGEGIVFYLGTLPIF